MKIFNKSILVFVFVVLTTVGAWIQIPFLPLFPLTLQVFFVLLSGALLGSILGALSQITYLLLGLPLAGLPIFFGKAFFSRGLSSFEILVGPQGGYLWGFVVASFVVGIVTERLKEVDFFGILMAMTGGLVVIYLFGLVQSAFLAQAPLASFVAQRGLTFLGADLLKVFLAAWVASRLRPAFSA